MPLGVLHGQPGLAQASQAGDHLDGGGGSTGPESAMHRGQEVFPADEVGARAMAAQFQHFLRGTGKANPGAASSRITAARHPVGAAGHAGQQAALGLFWICDAGNVDRDDRSNQRRRLAGAHLDRYQGAFLTGQMLVLGGRPGGAFRIGIIFR